MSWCVCWSCALKSWVENRGLCRRTNRLHALIDDSASHPLGRLDCVKHPVITDGFNDQTPAVIHLLDDLIPLAVLKQATTDVILLSPCVFCGLPVSKEEPRLGTSITHS